MIKFIKNILKFILILFISFIIFAYIFSLKSSISFEDSIAYLTNIANNFFGIDNSENIAVNSNIGTLQPNTSTNHHYYYDQLDDNGKIIYSALENNIDNLKKENYILDFSDTFNDLLNTTTGQYILNRTFQSALDAFFYDHPELFYLDLSKFSLSIKYISIGLIKTYRVEIVPDANNYLHNDFNSEQKVNAAIQKIEDIKCEVINETKNLSTYNKILYVHDMLVNSLQYDKTYTKQNIHNIYGAFVEKQVVCEGYAKSFKYLMDELDIECILIKGTATNSSNETEGHMWNYVKLNNSWYGVDITWDDPIIIGGSANDNLRYDFFLKGTKAFIYSHSPSGKLSDTGMLFSIPSLSYNNYR